ncbi:33432_t:CDS:2 [Gigaspora margarita]|uniref:33432_t:CDS:1 n=1 Tax=Gigaspora margarita TaxID=4874 RepID=A0ABN7X3X1_GIGMA|nr:33432_t:CDS:2 [Gigaspora margarita]
MKRQLKQKKNKEKGFDIYSAQFFLTYSRCDLSKEALLKHLEKLVNKKTKQQKYFISHYIIVNKQHKDKYPHKHVYIKLNNKIQIQKETFFDIKLDNETTYHPNIQGKIKIEEEYYTSPEKPFVEFHYEDKFCGKLLYTEKFNDKIAYRLDNKNWFDGYDKHSILVLDEFDSTQLSFSTLLKILSGQQRKLEIKGLQELNYIKHVIISSNYTLNELYKDNNYDQGQLDWCVDAIWHYRKSQDTFLNDNVKEIYIINNNIVNIWI